MVNAFKNQFWPLIDVFPSSHAAFFFKFSDTLSPLHFIFVRSIVLWLVINGAFWIQGKKLSSDRASSIVSSAPFQ